MSYEIKPYPPRQDGRVSYRILWNDYSGAAGKRRVQRHVPKQEWPAIGFRPEMSVEEAKDWARAVNKDAYQKKLEARRNKIMRRITDENNAVLAYLPDAFVVGFESEVLEQRYRGNLNSHWQAAKRLITAIKLGAFEWHTKPEVIYRYFAIKKISPSYCEKILRVLNQWGLYLASKTGKAYFPIKSPTGVNKERIADAYYDNRKSSKESAPITPDDLNSAKANLSTAHFNYLFITVWLGLRPMEVDKLPLGDVAWKIQYHDGVKVFACFQWKLTSVPRPKRWKYIPILFPEQEQAIAIIQGGDFKRPLPKTVRKHVKADANCYGGRKGFDALMRGKGRTFFEVQAWLGHSSIERTWRSYRNREKVFLDRQPTAAT